MSGSKDILKAIQWLVIFKLNLRSGLHLELVLNKRSAHNKILCRGCTNTIGVGKKEFWVLGNVFFIIYKRLSFAVRLANVKNTLFHTAMNSSQMDTHKPKKLEKGVFDRRIVRLICWSKEVELMKDKRDTENWGDERFRKGSGVGRLDFSFFFFF